MSLLQLSRALFYYQILIFLLYKLEAAILFYPGTQNDIHFSEEAQWLLHNFSRVINVTHKDYFTISKLEDQGIYGTIIRHSENIQKQYLKDIVELKPAYLCSYSIKDYLLETIPKDFQTGMTAVLPCSIVGKPKPRIWWQKWDPGKNSYVNITIQSNMRVTPSNHLVIYKSSVVHSGTYRCVGINQCGKRCFNEKVCTGLVVNGPLYELDIHNNFIAENNMYFLLDSITNAVSLTVNDNISCFLGTDSCKRADYCESAGYSEISLEGFFYGNDSFTSNLKKGYKKQLDQELCLYNCSDWDCSKTEPFLFGVCRNSLGSTMEFAVTMDGVPTIKAEINEQMLVASPSLIRFKTGSLSRVEVSCYHNNVKIIQDYHTSFSLETIKFSLFKYYVIKKDCPMRSDDGYYFCTAENIAGVGISTATNVIVTISDISDSCYPTTLLDRTTSQLTISWDQDKFEDERVNVITSHIACGKHDVPCEVRKKEHSVLGQNTTTITNLTSGCCYSVSVQLNNGSIVGENRNVSEYMPLPSYPTAAFYDVQLNASSVVHHDNYVTFRLFWSLPARPLWGDKSITYKINITETNTSSMVYNNYFDITSNDTLTFNQNMKYTGKISVCNSMGCGEHSPFMFHTPPSRPPFQPSISDLVVHCESIQFFVADQHPELTDFYGYVLIATADCREISSGVVGNRQVNITNLKSNTLYNLLLFGENRKGRSETVVIDDIKTELICEETLVVIGVVACSFFIVLAVTVSVVFVAKRNRKKMKPQRYQRPNYSHHVRLTESNEMLGIEIRHRDDVIVMNDDKVKSRWYRSYIWILQRYM